MSEQMKKQDEPQPIDSTLTRREGSSPSDDSAPRPLVTEREEEVKFEQRKSVYRATKKTEPKPRFEQRWEDEGGATQPPKVTHH